MHTYPTISQLVKAHHKSSQIIEGGEVDSVPRRSSSTTLQRVGPQRAWFNRGHDKIYSLIFSPPSYCSLYSCFCAFLELSGDTVQSYWRIGSKMLMGSSVHRIRVCCMRDAPLGDLTGPFVWGTPISKIPQDSVPKSQVATWWLGFSILSPVRRLFAVWCSVSATSLSRFRHPLCDPL